MDYSEKEDIIEHIFEKLKYLIVPSEKNNYKSRFLESNILLYCIVLLLILKITTAIILINFPQNIFFADITKISLTNLVNQGRESAGLSPLLQNEKLDQAAYLKAENMVQNQYFDHTSPTGASPWHWFLQAGYNYKYAGENLAIGFYNSEEVYNAWLNSPSHKANLLNPNYKEMGTAVLGGFGENNTIVVVQLFGSPKLQPAETKSPVYAGNKNINIKEEPSAVATEQESSGTITKEEVPFEFTGPKIVLGDAKSTASNSFYLKFLNYMLYGYEGLIQNIIYGISLVTIGILLASIFFSGGNFKRNFVFRSFLIAILLSLAILIDKEMIIFIVPHQIII